MKTRMLITATAATATAGVLTATAIADRNDTRAAGRAPLAVPASAAADRNDNRAAVRVPPPVTTVADRKSSRSQESAPRASAAVARVGDLDADLLFSGRLRLQAETSDDVNRLTFTYRGRRYTGRVVEVDREDRTREWERTIQARGADRRGNRTITIRARACDGDRCASRSSREFLEREDDD